MFINFYEIKQKKTIMYCFNTARLEWVLSRYLFSMNFAYLQELVSDMMESDLALMKQNPNA